MTTRDYEICLEIVGECLRQFAAIVSLGLFIWFIAVAALVFGGAL
jgi:hypothetical protein